MVCAVLISAPTASATAASRGVVGEWPLNEGVGTQAADISGSGNNGTLSGGATWVNDGSGSALSFDGVSGQVKVPNNPSLEPASGVTVQAWVKHTGSPGQYRYVLAKGATGCIAASYGLYTGPNGGLEFYVSRDRGTVYARSSDAGQAVWDGRWHLVVGTFDGDVIRLFVDGAEVGSGITYPGSLEYLLPASNDLYIGSYPGCDQHEFLGFIDDAMVWNRALTPQEVEGVLPEQGSGANPPLSPPASSGLTGATRRPDGSGPTQSGSTQPASGAPSLSRPRVFGRTLTLAADGRLERRRPPRGADPHLRRCPGLTRHADPDPPAVRRAPAPTLRCPTAHPGPASAQLYPPGRHRQFHPRRPAGDDHAPLHRNPRAPARERALPPRPDAAQPWPDRQARGGCVHRTVNRRSSREPTRTSI